MEDNKEKEVAEIIELQKKITEKYGYCLHAVPLEGTGMVDIHSHGLSAFNHPDLRINFSINYQNFAWTLMTHLCDCVVHGKIFKESIELVKIDMTEYQVMFSKTTFNTDLFDNDVLQVIFMS